MLTEPVSASSPLRRILDRVCSHGIVLLVEVVDVAIQDFDEKLDRDGGVHACVCDTESALEAFENALAVAVGLSGC